MSEQQPELAVGTVTHCLRCGRDCRRGVPDPNARALRKSPTEGWCPNCAITWFLVSIETIREIVEGTPARGNLVPAREGKGPEIFLAKHIREGWAPLLAHTQVRPEEIDWEVVVANWRLPWPKNRQPRPSDY